LWLWIKAKLLDLSKKVIWLLPSMAQRKKEETEGGKTDDGVIGKEH